MDISELDDDGFIAYMESEGAAWREAHVRNGSLRVGDMTLNYYSAPREDPKAEVVILHGYCEFFGKYHEMVQRLWESGCSVWFMEQRGHGYSGREVAEEDFVHVDSFEEYVADLRHFLDEVVLPATGAAGPHDGGTGRVVPRVLFGHSMGGAVAALFLEEHPGYFDRAFLSSPMFKVDTGMPYPVERALLKLFIMKEGPKKLVGVGKRFDGKSSFETSSARSRQRYDYQFGMRLADVHYRMWTGTAGWMRASVIAMRKVVADAGKATLPILIAQAGGDQLVHPAGHDAFLRRAEHARLVRFEDSAHEIFNALTPVRNRYYDTLVGFIEHGLDG